MATTKKKPQRTRIVTRVYRSPPVDAPKWRERSFVSEAAMFILAGASAATRVEPIELAEASAATRVEAAVTSAVNLLEELKKRRMFR
jgi:hypothetical protein